MEERAGGGALKVSALVNAIGVPVDWPQFLTNQPSRTLLSNEQTAGYLGMPGKDAKSPSMQFRLPILTAGGHIDLRI